MIYFLDAVAPLAKCFQLVRQRGPVVVTFYAKHLPESYTHAEALQDLNTTIRELEIGVDHQGKDIELNAALELKYKERVALEAQKKHNLHLGKGYTRQWRAPKALTQYPNVTFLAMPLDIQDEDQANFIADEYGVTRIPSVCGIDLSGIIARSQHYMDPDEFQVWMASFLSKTNDTV